MTVFGICMVKNADDIIGPVVEHMLGEVDHVIVANNLSTDNTYEVLSTFGDSITILSDDNPAHLQSEKTTLMAQTAGHMGAQWVVPFDSDEWWYTAGTLKDMIEQTQFDIYPAALYDHVVTGADPDEANPLKRIGWRRIEPSNLHKVACRVAPGLVIKDGNHNAEYPEDTRTIGWDYIQIRHFPYRSADQFVSKALVGAEALAKANKPHDVGAHWRDYAALAKAHGEDTLRSIFYEHFYAEDPYTRDDLIYDPVIR